MSNDAVPTRSTSASSSSFPQRAIGRRTGGPHGASSSSSLLLAARRLPTTNQFSCVMMAVVKILGVMLVVIHHHPTAAASAAAAASSLVAPTTRTTPTSYYTVDVSGHPEWRENPGVMMDFLGQHLDNVSHAAALYQARGQSSVGNNHTTTNNLNNIDDDDSAVVDVTIDVSHCALTDDDFIALIDEALFPLRYPLTKNNDDRPAGRPLRLHLYARANHDLSPRSMAHLLERVLELHNRTTTASFAGAIANTTNARPDGGEAASSTPNATATVAAAEGEEDAGPINNSTTTSTSTAASVAASSEDSSAALSRPPGPPIRYLGSLDVCWSRLGDPPPFVELETTDDHDARQNAATKARTRRRRQKLYQQQVTHAKAFRTALRTLVATPDACPSILRLDRCGLGPSHCRALAKGLVQRWGVDDDDIVNTNNRNPPVAMETTRTEEELRRRHQRLALHLSGNGAIGDAGAAALAAALRTAATAPSLQHQHPSSRDGTNSNHNHHEPPLLDVLDLSACQVGDVGAQAMAVALEEDVDAALDGSGTVLVDHLDLKLNRMTDVGAAALGRALTSRSNRHPAPLQCLDLSGNADIGDKGATTLALAVGTGRLPIATVRCCAIGADGAAAFGRALRRRATATTTGGHRNTPVTVEVDLSGNPLGVLRGKKKDEGKYSASRLKSKATATAASYMSQGVSFLKRNLKDVGVDVSPIFGSGLSGESDDEEEEKDASGLPDDEYDPSKGRCGAKALVNAFLETPKDDNAAGGGLATGLQMKLGLRHCSFDHGAADALAALRVHVRDELGLELELDVRLNSVLEEEMVGALHGNKAHDDLLREMAERHQDALEALREARERAAYASAAVAAKVRARADANDQCEAQWDAPDMVDGQSEDWDSDADYEDGETA